MHAILPMLIVTGTLVLASEALAFPAYTVQDLGPVFIHAVQDDGISVGTSMQPLGQDPGQQAVLVRRAGRQVPLGYLPGGTVSQAHGIHKTRVVGQSLTVVDGVLASHAFVTTRRGLRDLGTLGGVAWFSAALGLNGAHAIIGSAEDRLPDGTALEVPVVWLDGHITRLATLGGPQGIAAAINEDGDIAGESETQHGTPTATLWPIDGPPFSLDTLGATQSRALAITDSRHVAGEVVLAGVGPRGFVWTPDTGMAVLGPLPDYATSLAVGIDAMGLVVGGSAGLIGGECCDEAPRAVAWQDGQVIDLNTRIRARGWVLEQATASNAEGQIVGLGRLHGEPRAFLLTPVHPPVVRQRASGHHFVQALKARLAQERHAGR